MPGKKPFIPKKKKQFTHTKTQPKKGAAKEKSNKESDAESIVMGVILGAGNDVMLKNIFPKLLTKLSQEDIVFALTELDHKGFIQIGQKGIVKILKSKEREQSQSRAKFVIGTADITRAGSAFVSVDGMDKDIFIPPKFVKNAMQGDSVRIRITVFGRRPEGEVIEVVKRSQDSFTGRLEVLEKFAFFIADETKIKTDVFVPLHSLRNAKNNDRVIVRITDWQSGTKKPIGEVVEVLSAEHTSDYDMKMILIQNGFSIDFPNDCYIELEKYTDKISEAEIAKRVDFRNTLTFTIDPEDAKDFDDAISFKKLDNGKLEIGVHIADVSHYVREGSQLDKEAERRATSVYLPDRVCPMLPEKLSNVLCSLRPNEDKLTFSAIFEMTEEGNITHFGIAKTVIHSKRRFTYEEAQQVIETGEGDCAYELKTLDKIAKKIRAARMKNGAIAFEKDEVRFKLDETGKPLGVYLKTRKDAHLLVEDFMLLANETVAKFGSKPGKHNKQHAFVYRIHDKPDPAKLELFSSVASRFGYQVSFEDDAAQIASTLNTMLKKVEGKPEQNVIETMAIRSMAKAAYTTKNIGHYGLAMEYYTHFTSPIRRYPDVLVHRLAHELLIGGDKMIDKVELETRCKNSSLMERKAMDAEREATKYKQIEYLSDKEGEIFEGLIAGVTARGVFVEIISNKCEGMVSTELLGDEDFVYEERMMRLVGAKSKKKFQLGDKVNVKVLRADIVLRRIDMMIV
jgi:ribonuclease R